MNINVIRKYEEVLKKVLEEFGISEQAMFSKNDAECVQARQALIIALTDMGLSDKDIAECTHKMRRCSVCQIRNRYKNDNVAWTVRMCIERIKNG